MSFLRVLAAGLHSLLRRELVERDLDEELAGYLEMAANEKLRQGMSGEEARRAVRVEIGSVDATKEVVRAAGWEFVVETWLQDFRIAARSLWRNRSFAAVAILILGLGIGACKAVFSLVHAVMIKPLAYPDAGRIVVVSSFWKPLNARGNVSWLDFQDWRSQNASFEAMACFAPGESPLMLESGPEFGRVAEVSGTFFDVWGVEPAGGRLFGPEDTISTGRVAIVSRSFSRAHFGDNAALGKTIHRNGQRLVIVGVMPAGFSFPDKTDVWTLADPGSDPNRGDHRYRAVGRLKAGANIEA